MDRKNSLSFFKDILSLVYLSLLIALYVVLSFFTIYITKEIRFSLTFMPVSWASVIMGPIAGGITGAFGDVLSWVIKPAGPFFPGFTISGLISGIIYGIFLYKKDLTLRRVFFAAVSVVLIVELGLNTLWLMILYGSPFEVLIAGRLIKAPFTMAIQMLVLYSSCYGLKKINLRLNKGRGIV